MAGGRKDRGLYDGRNVSGARMWLEVGATEYSIVDAMYKEKGVGGGRIDKGLYDECNVKGARMWQEVEATEDIMVDTMYQEPGRGRR